MSILVINSGSSSIKCSLFQETGGTLQAVWNAQISWTSQTSCSMNWRAKDGKRNESKLDGTTYEAAVLACFDTIYESGCAKDKSDISAVGHRIVHGGSKFKMSTLIGQSVLKDIESLVGLAPAHQPGNIKGVELAMKTFPGVPQIAAFDTAFHHTLPLSNAIYAAPYQWYMQGIRRYGFHGISHQYCSQKAAELVDRPLDSLRIITCHLGSGCSLAAIRYGESVMTTMGFTPLEGLVMRTRSGSLDPGLILHLLHEKKYTSAELSDILNNQSGLKGLSGLSGDMRDIESRMYEGHAGARLAFDIFISSLSSHISALLPTLGGADVIAFTGGIGENSATVRSACMSALSFLGLVLDSEINETIQGDAMISTVDSKMSICVVRAQEELAIAQDCQRLVAQLTV
jgi:acetate kinase